ADKRPGMNSAISGLKMVTVITKVSRTVMPAIVPTGQVFAHKLGVFASDDKGFFAFLSCSIHYWWAASRASTMKADLNYSPSDVFETLPLPDITENLRNLGERLEKSRQRIMLSRQIGLTKAYGLAFDSACKEADVIDLREIHKMIDYAAIRAYGWDDMIERGLDHGFHPAGKYTRYTIGPWAQREVLDRLLELNHARYAEEVAAGLHEKGAKKKGARAKPVPTEESGATLFDL
ncbi:hypothetical protein MXD59_25950, partial [Frankia sp. Ag45/Mut15]|nr:hypothetical protein [Frankia umida]